ncbi:uncharacterized protein LOC142981522 [Anticarsia gemmatalis]|uniref:uncharacterized protein LOC142981522 n=1 Tax=Anticarsia gemmatalis TaxID=129554 RepID=UPI003F7738A9
MLKLKVINAMRLVLILLSCNILCCLSVREDYFLDDDDRNTKNQNENSTIITVLRRSEQLQKDTIWKSTNVTKLQTVNSNEDAYDSDADDNIAMVGGLISDSEYSEINQNEYERKANDFRSNSFLDLLKDYVYLYDEPTSPGYVRSQDMQTFPALKDNETNFIRNITDGENSNKEKVLVDFYNLKPAGSQLSPENETLIGDNINLYENQVFWYVPDNIPCWNLPILYGELGEKLTNDEVFLTYKGKLKKVTENTENEEKTLKEANIPVSQAMNKWCAADPCYGDHTLCLFPEMVNSKLCTRKYKVFTPTMMQRVKLVNNLNSMRNRVANRGTKLYRHLPTAANMRQVIYDTDLQNMAAAWLHQCLPGPSACSSLDDELVAQLECTKYAKQCCMSDDENDILSKCIPRRGCFFDALTGCLYTWFRMAAQDLTATDVECGHITPATYNTVQLLWAKTSKIGCAYARSVMGNVRVVCNFAPGATFTISTKFFCGFISHQAMIEDFIDNITTPGFLADLGIVLYPQKTLNITHEKHWSTNVNYSLRMSDIDILSKVYRSKWMRDVLDDKSNSTLGFVARLVTRYTFEAENGPQCDSGKNIYQPGEPGSLCLAKGRRFYSLCYDFRNPISGYRLVAVVAPIALFSLILYDLFSGVVRQTNY